MVVSRTVGLAVEIAPRARTRAPIVALPAGSSAGAEIDVEPQRREIIDRARGRAVCAEISAPLDTTTV